MTPISRNLKSHWAAIGPLLSIRSDREYDLGVIQLNELLGEIGTDEKHPLYGLLDTLGTLIASFEETHYPIPESGGPDVLRFLMEEHGVKQSDLPEIGSRRVVFEIVNGKRELNIRQIRALAKRFHVSPAVFI